MEKDDDEEDPVFSTLLTQNTMRRDSKNNTGSLIGIRPPQPPFNPDHHTNGMYYVRLHTTAFEFDLSTNSIS
jgi:hypothetical protein